MNQLLIGGIGDLLLGDFGIGPFAVKVLRTRYDFHEKVEVVDLGTSSRELQSRLSRADHVILIQSTDFRGESGAIRLFREPNSLRDLLRGSDAAHGCGIRCPFSQLTEPIRGHLLLIGMQGSRFEPGSRLSKPVRQCVPHIIDAVLRELYRLDVWCEPKANAGCSGSWWDPIESDA